jgi:hypothetical protein
LPAVRDARVGRLRQEAEALADMAFLFPYA